MPYADKATRKVIEENFVSDSESESESESECESASTAGPEIDERKKVSGRTGYRPRQELGLKAGGKRFQGRTSAQERKRKLCER